MIIDCDPGVDDALALAVVAGTDGLGVDAVVAVGGNVDADLTRRNAARLVSALGLDVPVGAGSTEALIGPYPGRASEVHHEDGLGGVAHLLAEPPLELVDGVPLIRGDVVATGPLTDVARALHAGAEIERVVWMGGSVGAGGNVTAAAEFNAWCDPEAADVVVTSGVPVWIVPLDVTHEVVLAENDAEHLDDGTDLGRFLAAVGRFMTGTDRPAPSGDHDPRRRAYLHDPVAVIAAVAPELFEWRALDVRVEATGTFTRGQTVADRRPGRSGPVQVALGVDAAAVHDRIVTALCRAKDLRGGRQ